MRGRGRREGGRGEQEGRKSERKRRTIKRKRRTVRRNRNEKKNYGRGQRRRTSEAITHGGN